MLWIRSTKRVKKKYEDSDTLVRCNYFIIVDINDSKILDVRVVNNQEDGEHNCANPVKILNREGVSLVLVTNIGPRPSSIFRQHGIGVLCGAVGSVKDALEDYFSGFLMPVSLDNLCNCHEKEAR